MRYGTAIYFQQITPGEYDPETGNYGEDKVVEIKQMANVTSAGMEALNLIYGEVKQDALVIRIQSHYSGIFSYIRIGKKQYRVDYSRPLNARQTYVVSEVQ